MAYKPALHAYNPIIDSFFYAYSAIVDSFFFEKDYIPQYYR